LAVLPFGIFGLFDPFSPLEPLITWALSRGLTLFG